VSAVRCTDPVSGDAVLLLAQLDVSAKVAAERHIAMVSETEHRLLEQIFPRHGACVYGRTVRGKLRPRVAW
jgi:hypothetical protein